jgi:hypothetical protein
VIQTIEMLHVNRSMASHAQRTARKWKMTEAAEKFGRNREFAEAQIAQLSALVSTEGMPVWGLRNVAK